MAVKLSAKGTVTPVRADRAALIDDVGGADNVRLADLSAVEDLFTAPEINTQTGTTYTLVLGDQGKIVEMNNVSANTLTIPANASVAFPTGAVIAITQFGAGATTVSGDTGVTVNGVSAGSATLTAQYSGVSIYKRGTNEWVLQGDHGGVA